MDLKRFQRRVVRRIEEYLQLVAEQRAGGNTRYATRAAWDELGLGPYQDRKNGLGEDLPTFCIKVPTGGGKTLLATQILGSAYRTLLKDRNGAGLVLWVVPSSQIYRDTLKRLRDRGDMYRLMLEHALSRRIEVWEKHEIARLSPARLRDCLNILVVQLASTNRQTKEDLKFFQDSGGNIVDHFPPETDYDAHRQLKGRIKNLDMLVEDDASGQYLAKTSVGNLVKICRPVVILDEGHKATSTRARQTIEEFNASLVVELSATPKTAKAEGVEFRPNIICRVTGKELLDEEMIKLPLNIATSGQKDWKDVMTQARDRRELLAKKADKYAERMGPARLIRPMVLVQVERTGRDQREAGFIHSEDVKEYLTQTLGVPETAVKIKTAELDELSDVDNLMDPLCPVQWIITKAALQEGWDCPFAYILVSLNNTASTTGMTQIVGRILRQPFQERTPQDVGELNESYVYCLHLRAGQLTAAVKKALEAEGLEDASGLVFDATDARATKPERVARIREEFAALYRKPFKGKIYLPHFCVKTGDGYEPLDYFRHLLPSVDVDRFPYDRINWEMADALKQAKDRFYRISLGSELMREQETEADHVEGDAATRAWIVASLTFDYLSHKQLRRIVAAVCGKLVASELSLKDRLSLVKFIVRDHIHRWVQEHVDKQTEGVLKGLFEKDRLVFYLECADCRFTIPDELKVRAGRPLAHDNGDLTNKSLFDFVADDQQNSYERAVALCLDRDENVLWWYRNLVGEGSFGIQGYRRNRLRPDFVAQGSIDSHPNHLVWVVESKGKHLKGNEDTEYKRDVARLFSKVGRQVSWQQLGDEFKNHRFCFQVLDEAQEEGRDWKDQLRTILSSDGAG
ncbi:MAG TPA: DEAD/DEAH box helicase family protein [Tepidisphaeraceae bacterium]|jgi:type III restriction enzyme|nr:DEAD/DEAH box helicase family protein [Tepidisphaeraceae bacterium]